MDRRRPLPGQLVLMVIVGAVVVACGQAAPNHASAPPPSPSQAATTLSQEFTTTRIENSLGSMRSIVAPAPDTLSVSIELQDEVDVSVHTNQPLHGPQVLERAAQDTVLVAKVVFSRFPKAATVLLTFDEALMGQGGTRAEDAVVAVQVAARTYARWNYSDLQAKLSANPSAVLCAADYYYIHDQVWAQLDAQSRGCLSSPDTFDD